DRLRPGALEETGLTCVIRDVRQRAGTAHGPALEAARDVANHPVEESAEAGHSTGPGGVQRAALAETFDEHLLHRVVEISAQRRVSPAGAEVRADDAEVAPTQFVAVGGAAGRGGTDDGPAGGFRGGQGAYSPKGTAFGAVTAIPSIIR